MRLSAARAICRGIPGVLNFLLCAKKFPAPAHWEFSLKFLESILLSARISTMASEKREIPCSYPAAGILPPP
jgi:hypothetical protein